MVPVRARSSRTDRRLSPEVRWYLKSRGIPEPDCPPAIMTPEPRNVPGARFDPERVDKVLTAFSLLRHTQGQWAGQPLSPDPWEVAYVIAPVFGWVEPDGLGGWVRIIRKLHIEVPRKNGKTTLAGGIAIYLTTADGEPGAQVCAVARGKEQARFCFDPIKLLAEAAPALKPFVRTTRDRITHKRSGSFFAVMSKLADLMHGANPHGGIVDELHLYTSPDMVDALESGMGSRREPLLVFITTAGDDDEETVYAKQHARIRQLAKKLIRDPSTFGVIWAADPKADPFAEKTWKSANPGYGISPTKKFMQSQALEAQQSPGKLASFLRLHLNIRTSVETKFIPLNVWDASGGIVDESKLDQLLCWGGLDLSHTQDLTAWVMVFAPEDLDHGAFQVLCRFWVPEDGLTERSRRDGVDYARWRDEGFIRTTPGNTIDYETIENAILADAQRFAIQDIAYDPAYAGQIAQRLIARGLQMFKFRQGMYTMAPPTSDAIALLSAKRLLDGGNPVLRLLVDGTITVTNADGLVMPAKGKSTRRIDGVVATLMAVARVQANLFGEPEETEQVLVYDDRVTIGPRF